MTLSTLMCCQGFLPMRAGGESFYVYFPVLNTVVIQVHTLLGGIVLFCITGHLYPTFFGPFHISR